MTDDLPRHVNILACPFLFLKLAPTIEHRITVNLRSRSAGEKSGGFLEWRGEPATLPNFRKSDFTAFRLVLHLRSAAARARRQRNNRRDRD